MIASMLATRSDFCDAFSWIYAEPDSKGYAIGQTKIPMPSLHTWSHYSFCKQSEVHTEYTIVKRGCTWLSSPRYLKYNNVLECTNNDRRKLFQRELMWGNANNLNFTQNTLLLNAGLNEAVLGCQAHAASNTTMFQNARTMIDANFFNVSWHGAMQTIWISHRTHYC